MGYHCLTWQRLTKRNCVDTSFRRRDLAPAYIRAIEALSSIALRTALLIANAGTSLLCRRDLGLEGGGIGVDPLELRQMAIEDTDNLAQLFGRVSNSKKQQRDKLVLGARIYLPGHQACCPC